MKLELFKSELSKGQLEAMAIDLSVKVFNEGDPLESHIWLKKVKYFVEAAIKENQKNALLNWEQRKDDFENITHVNGKKTYDFKHIEVWKEMADYRKDIEDCAKKAIQSKTPVLYVHPFTGETIVIEAAKVKESAETLNVKI